MHAADLTFSRNLCPPWTNLHWNLLKMGFFRGWFTRKWNFQYFSKLSKWLVFDLFRIPEYCRMLKIHYFQGITAINMILSTMDRFSGKGRCSGKRLSKIRVGCITSKKPLMISAVTHIQTCTAFFLAIWPNILLGEHIWKWPVPWLFIDWK